MNDVEFGILSAKVDRLLADMQDTNTRVREIELALAGKEGMHHAGRAWRASLWSAFALGCGTAGGLVGRFVGGH